MSEHDPVPIRCKTWWFGSVVWDGVLGWDKKWTGDQGTMGYESTMYDTLQEYAGIILLAHHSKIAKAVVLNLGELNSAMPRQSALSTSNPPYSR